MTNMGIGSVASSSENPTEAENQARSGSGFDINQVEAGAKISILNSTFNGCGDPADKDKAGITGIANEPWHFRYVGEYAKMIKESNLCLEDYIKQNFI